MIVVLSSIIYYPQIMRKLIIALSIILLSSCVVTESIKLDGRSGSSTTDINVEQFFIDVLEDFDVFCGLYSFRENRLDVFAIDLDIPISSGHILSILIL